MLYLEYRDLRKRFREVETDYYNALTEGSKLLCSVSPRSVQAKEVVNHTSNTSPDDAFVNYTSEIDKIDELINKTRDDKDMLEYELKKKEAEMKNSKDVHDRIYVYKWIEHKSVYKFCKLMGYSKSQVYRYIDEIEEKIYSK